MKECAASRADRWKLGVAKNLREVRRQVQRERCASGFGHPFDQRAENLRSVVVGTPSLEHASVEVDDPIFRDAIALIQRALLHPVALCTRRREYFGRKHQALDRIAAAKSRDFFRRHDKDVGLNGSTGFQVDVARRDGREPEPLRTNVRI